MRYLREHTELNIAETDEEVMRANNNVWPDDELKNKVFIPKTTNEILGRENVIYFANYIPTELIQKAKERGFKIIVMKIPLEELLKRDKGRMHEENYESVSQWFAGQLDNFQDLMKQDLVGQTIDGHKPIEQLAKEIISLAK